LPDQKASDSALDALDMMDQWRILPFCLYLGPTQDPGHQTHWGWV